MLSCGFGYEEQITVPARGTSLPSSMRLPPPEVEAATPVAAAAARGLAARRIGCGSVPPVPAVEAALAMEDAATALAVLRCGRLTLPLRLTHCQVAGVVAVEGRCWHAKPLPQAGLHLVEAGWSEAAHQGRPEDAASARNAMGRGKALARAGTLQGAASSGRCPARQQHRLEAGGSSGCSCMAAAPPGAAAGTPARQAGRQAADLLPHRMPTAPL